MFDQQFRDELRAALRDVLPDLLPGLLPVILEKLNRPEPMGQRLTVADAAKVARVAPVTIQRACRRGDLSAAKPQGSRHWLIERADLDRWIRGPKGSGRVDLDAHAEEAVAKILR